MSIPVSHIMRARVAFCEENSPLRKVAEAVLSENLGSILVNRGEQSVGIITSNDLLRAVLKGLDFNTTPAREIMSHPLETCDSEKSLDQVMKQFEETGRTRLVITRGDRVAGILKRSVAERFKGITGVYQFSPKTRSLPFRRGGG